MPSTDPNRGAETASVVGFDALYGLEVVEVGDGLVRGRLAITHDHHQPAGIVHGGVHATIAEALTSMGTWVALGGEKAVSGMNNNTSFLRPMSEGSAHATARARHRGRTTWVWEVDITDDAGRLVALSRVTIAVRDP